MQIRGQINSVEKKEGMSQYNKPYVKWDFKIGDKKYSTFNADYAEKFKIGDKVVIDGEMKGKYFNMTYMRLDDGKTEEVEKSSENGSNTELQGVLDLLRQILAELKKSNESTNN